MNARGADSSSARPVVIAHAFSRKNSGDGLLVDLTLRLLEAAGIPRRETRLLALDAPSFADQRDLGVDVRAVPGEPRGARVSLRLAGATLEIARAGAAEIAHALPLALEPPPLVRRRGGQVGRMLEGARGVVAVGGGYLVADSTVRQGGVLLNHLPQLLAAGRATQSTARVPSIYLPQSIGPLQGPIGELTRRALSRVDVIYARDDETLAELRGLTDVRRCPDLAVLRLAESLAAAPPSSRTTGAGARTTGAGARSGATSSARPTIVVPRELPRSPGYHDALIALGASLPSTLWAVQADVDGPRSDRRFLDVLHVPDAGDLSTLLVRETPGVVVSVRLHGAIASLIAGWPAIHLSYERKGWGAYEDLGLAEYVHDARRFDVDKVRAQAIELHANPQRMFDRIAERVPALRTAQRALIDEIAARFR